MFLFEKSLIVGYWNRFCDFGERLGYFSCYDRIKAYNAAKELDVTNIDTKDGQSSCQIGLPLNSLFP